MKMKMFAACAALVLSAWALTAAQPAQALCTSVAVTADEMSKDGAVVRSQSGLQDAIDKWAKQNRIKKVRVSPLKAKPQPYWRDTVTADLFLKPDVKTAKYYTVCWRGVISPAVCTSGARVCG